MLRQFALHEVAPPSFLTSSRGPLMGASVVHDAATPVFETFLRIGNLGSLSSSHLLVRAPAFSFPTVSHSPPRLIHFGFPPAGLMYLCAPGLLRSRGTFSLWPFRIVTCVGALLLILERALVCMCQAQGLVMFYQSIPGFWDIRCESFADAHFSDPLHRARVNHSPPPVPADVLTRLLAAHVHPGESLLRWAGWCGFVCVCRHLTSFLRASTNASFCTCKRQVAPSSPQILSDPHEAFRF